MVSPDSMASDPKQRQKRIAKKAAKRKLHSTAKKLFQKVGVNYEAVRDMTMAADCPVYDSLVPENLFEQGIGNVVLSRNLTNGRIAAGVILVDVFCLGIKNCFFTVTTPVEYQNFLNKISAHGALETWHPSCIVKLIRESINYARDLGFQPHADFAFTQKILKNLDPDPCPRSFTFGRDGKPFYISGPHEKPKDIQKIMKTLDRHKGPGGFDYQIVVSEEGEE